MSRWTEDELARLQTMSAAGYTFVQMADVLGRSRSSIAGKMWRLGVRRMRTPLKADAAAERDRKMAADFRSGMTTRDLGKKYGLERDSVGARLSKLGVHISMSERVRRQKIAMARNGSKPGRKPVWPDCPDHIRPEYMKLRKHYGYRAAEARAVLENEL